VLRGVRGIAFTEFNDRRRAPPAGQRIVDAYERRHAPRERVDGTERAAASRRATLALSIAARAIRRRCAARPRAAAPLGARGAASAAALSRCARRRGRGARAEPRYRGKDYADQRADLRLRRCPRDESGAGRHRDLPAGRARARRARRASRARTSRTWWCTACCTCRARPRATTTRRARWSARDDGSCAASDRRPLRAEHRVRRGPDPSPGRRYPAPDPTPRRCPTPERMDANLPRPSLLERSRAAAARARGPRPAARSCCTAGHERNLLDADALSMIEGVLQVSEMRCATS
jgi:hypothetical protein